MLRALGSSLPIASDTNRRRLRAVLEQALDLHALVRFHPIRGWSAGDTWSLIQWRSTVWISAAHVGAVAAPQGSRSPRPRVPNPPGRSPARRRPCAAATRPVRGTTGRGRCHTRSCRMPFGWVTACSASLPLPTPHSGGGTERLQSDAPSRNGAAGPAGSGRAGPDEFRRRRSRFRRRCRPGEFMPGGQISVTARIARSVTSITRRQRLPSSRIMASCSSRHTGSLGRMPRPRQISARTAPIGRRRTSAAICPGVGRRARRGSASWATGAVAGRGTRGVGADAAPRGAASRRAALRTILTSSASARCKPREMRARISARSVVPKRRVTKSGSVKARRRIVVASSLPWSISLRTRSSRRSLRLGWVVGVEVRAAAIMNITRTYVVADVKEYFQDGSLIRSAVSARIAEKDYE